jgi:hypothetical protein
MSIQKYDDFLVLMIENMFEAKSGATDFVHEKHFNEFMGQVHSSKGRIYTKKDKSTAAAKLMTTFPGVTRIKKTTLYHYHANSTDSYSVAGPVFMGLAFRPNVEGAPIKYVKKPVPRAGDGGDRGDIYFGEEESLQVFGELTATQRLTMVMYPETSFEQLVPMMVFFNATHPKNHTLRLSGDVVEARLPEKGWVQITPRALLNTVLNHFARLLKMVRDERPDLNYGVASYAEFLLGALAGEEDVKLPCGLEMVYNTSFRKGNTRMFPILEEVKPKEMMEVVINKATFLLECRVEGFEYQEGAEYASELLDD